MKGKIIAAVVLLGTSVLTATSQTNVYATDSLKIKTLKEVSVVGTLANRKTPVSYSTVSRKEISKNNFGQDLPYLFNMTPSFVATSDAGTGIGYTGMRIRGVDATRINVMINGVPYNDSESQGTFFVDIPDVASSLSNVQIQRGAGTSANGAGAFGATVNMQTIGLSADRFTEYGISGGSFATLRHSFSFGTGRLMNHWAVEGRVSSIKSNGYVDRAAVNLLGYFVQGGYFGDNTTLKFIAFGGNQVTGIAWNGIEQPDIDKYGRKYNSAGDMKIGGKAAKRYRKNTDNYLQNHYQLVMAHSFSENLSLNLTAHYTRGFGYTDEYRTGRKLVEYGLQPYTDPVSGEKVKKVSLIREKYLDNNFYGLVGTIEYKTKDLTLTIGGSGNHYDGKHYGYITWIEKYLTPVYPNDKYYDGMGKKKEFSSFVKANYELARGLNLYGDLQYRFIDYRITGKTDNAKRISDMNLTKKFNFINPKAGFMYNFDNHNAVYGSVAVAQREPDRHSYTDVLPKDYPSSEKLLDYELGYIHSNHHFSFGANLYYMDYLNQLVATGRKSDVGENIMQNIKDSYRMGVELTYELKFLKYLTFNGSIAISKNKIKEYKYSYEVYDENYNDLPMIERTFHNNDIAFSPNVVTANMLSFDYKGFNIGLVNKFVGRQYLDNTQNKEKSIPSYDLTDLKMGYQFSTKLFEGIIVNLSVNNLFNKQYTNNGWAYSSILSKNGNLEDQNGKGIYPQAGINSLMGVTIKL